MPLTSALEQVTVNLTQRSYQALDEAAQLTGDSRTDTINRALQVYAFVVNMTARHGDLYAREDGRGELELLRFR